MFHNGNILKWKYSTMDKELTIETQQPSGYKGNDKPKDGV